MVAQERLQHLAVGGKPIGPEVVAHELARGAQLLLDERQRHLRRRRVLERGQALRLRLREGLEHRRRQPGMLLDQLAADADDVHDRKNAGALEIVAAGRDRIGKQPADMGIVLASKTRRARRDEAVDIASLQELGDGRAGRRILHVHARRQFDGDLLRPPGMLDASRTQIMSDGFTPWSSCRMMRAHTQAVS